MNKKKAEIKERFDDITTDSGTGHQWSQICATCVGELGLTRFIKNGVKVGGGSGVCGVKFCTKEADYYIDFPDNDEEETIIS